MSFVGVGRSWSELVVMPKPEAGVPWIKFSFCTRHSPPSVLECARSLGTPPFLAFTTGKRAGYSRVTAGRLSPPPHGHPDHMAKVSAPIRLED